MSAACAVTEVTFSHSQFRDNECFVLCKATDMPTGQQIRNANQLIVQAGGTGLYGIAFGAVHA
jgi:hypothetical protein